MTTALIIYFGYAYTLGLILVFGQGRKLSNLDESDRD
ncbi:hypothetical protein Cha6605_2057 [Chamaesiphon minutus PCC 6605]|uniref:Uncharacterized protein n=1 Tax=Chamaesiphon minutus (strain ATCC 27169 / PCC 6605) TaxID=1173020 RepID=K9UDG1_CHAP6|nr:hypothetical protein Cha6605_2057 [Chamaesiphon minutus PCC 6605]